MSVNYSDFNNLASKLLDGTDEIDWRVSASRSYYSAYHLAKGAAVFCPSINHLQYGAHEGLAKRFELHDTKGAKSIAYVLNSMKKKRHIADYDIVADFTKESATEQLSELKCFRDRIVAFELTCKSN